VEARYLDIAYLRKQCVDCDFRIGAVRSFLACTPSDDDRSRLNESTEKKKLFSLLDFRFFTRRESFMAVVESTGALRYLEKQLFSLADKDFYSLTN
jgi:hypothetical protein